MLTTENKNGPVVLVSCNISYTFPLSYPYLASYLVSQGEDVRMLFKVGDYRELIRKIIALKPVAVGFGNLFVELKETGELIKMLNQAGRNFPVIVGGQMVSPTPEFAVEITGADIGVIGEGEIILNQVIKALRSGGDLLCIKGIVVSEENGSFINTGEGEYIEDLTKLPPIEYDLFPTDMWLNIGKFYQKSQWHWEPDDKVINVHGGRGCPWRCNFCYHHSKPRYRPVELMMEEADAALKRFDANLVYFSDDTTINKVARVEEIIDGINNLSRKVGYHISTRIDILSKIDNDYLKQMKEAGCRVVGIGIESGSDRILKIMGKPYTADAVRDCISRLAAVGIHSTVSIQVGQFTETTEDAQASYDLMIETVRIDPKIQYAFTITTPFPGSPLYKYLLNEGLIKNHRDFYDRYFSTGECWKQVVNFSAMPDNEIQMWLHKLEKTYAQMRTRRTP